MYFEYIIYIKYSGYLAGVPLHIVITHLTPRGTRLNCHMCVPAEIAWNIKRDSTCG